MYEVDEWHSNTPFVNDDYENSGAAATRLRARYLVVLIPLCSLMTVISTKCLGWWLFENFKCIWLMRWRVAVYE